MSSRATKKAAAARAAVVEDVVPTPAPPPEPTFKRAATAPSAMWPGLASGGGMRSPTRATTQTSPPAPAPPPPQPAAAPASPPPPVAAAEAPVAAATPAPTPPEPEPAPVAQQVQSQNAWSALVAERAARGQQKANQALPQGEMQLVHAWVQVLHVQQVPARACTIWLRRTEPSTACYERYIPGESVGGSGDITPDRMLWDCVQNLRAQPSIREKFTGRIRAMLPDGAMLDMGAGEIDLPPVVQASAQGQGAAAWGSLQERQQGGGQWGGYGSSPPQGGGQTPYGASAQPPAAVMNDPAALVMWKALQQQNELLLKTVIERGGAPPVAAAPATVQQDPLALAAWNQMREQNEMMMKLLLEKKAEPAAAPAAVRDPLDASFALLDRVLGLRDRLAPAAPPEPPASRIQTHEGITVFTDKDGDIDVAGTSTFGVLKEVKDIARTYVASRGGGLGASGMKSPTKATNGVVKS